MTNNDIAKILESKQIIKVSNLSKNKYWDFIKSKQNQYWDFIEIGISACANKYSLNMLEAELLERDYVPTEKELCKLFGYKRTETLTEKGIVAESKEISRYTFIIKYLQLFGGIAFLAGLDANFFESKKNKSKCVIGDMLPNLYIKTFVPGKELAEIIGCSTNTISNLKKKDEKIFLIFELGVLCWKKGVTLNTINSRINELDVTDVNTKLMNLLGYKQNRRDKEFYLLTDSSILTDKKNEALYNTKFKLKYFHILGALAKLANINFFHIDEFANEDEAMWEITKLPSYEK